MAGHGGDQNDDDAQAEPTTRRPAAGSGGQGGDARPISLLGLRLTDTQSPRDAMVTRRNARPRPAPTAAPPRTPDPGPTQ
ncbi:hypothetical protein MXD61_15690, partial [Frankia sp. AgPm24]|nr:hypothetical protein [Frankia sp. AgPm24]